MTPVDSKPVDKLTARDVMQTELLTVSISTPLSEVERLLGEHGVGGVPVTNETGHLVGVVSMRDLVERYAEGPVNRADLAPGFYHDMLETGDENMTTFGGFAGDGETASDIMTGGVYDVETDATLQHVAREMLRLKIHRILVKEKGKHVGLISAFDLLKAFAG